MRERLPREARKREYIFRPCAVDGRYYRRVQVQEWTKEVRGTMRGERNGWVVEGDPSGYGVSRPKRRKFREDFEAQSFCWSGEKKQEI